MSSVSISFPAIRKSVHIHLGAPGRAATAVLLGSSGEALKTFPLAEGANELPLDGFSAGCYALRVERGSEVVVEQIIIP